MLYIYNTLTRSKELFEPLAPPLVGLYVCGPTVYGEPHLGHARQAVTFDLLYRYLLSLDYRVRYVRNITDVGHLEHDADQGEDKIAQRARLEQLEPMEVAHRYTELYHRAMDALGVLSPSIEPRASGHIIEQIEMVKRILASGYAYEAGGSVYFDVAKYASNHHYGRLSGRNIDEMMGGTRALDGSGDKRSPLDFALWKKASPEHIMHWPSPWSEGFPGWHMECSAMSLKYLGDRFDIHGGGMDLIFPHHEAEIAQSTAACGHEAVRYWMHNNMLTLGGQKMGKSLGNAISLNQFFTGDHPLLTQAWSPMTIRFFILQAHYRSTLDFSNEALAAAEKGLDRLMKAMATLEKLSANTPDGLPTLSRATIENDLIADFNGHMNDDLGSPRAIATLFGWVTTINELHTGTRGIAPEDLALLKSTMKLFVHDILGLAGDGELSAEDRLTPVVDLLMELRSGAKANRDWALSDLIRDRLAAAGIKVMDKKEGPSEWQLQ